MQTITQYDVNMDVRQLETFAAVAARQSFTKAAAELHTVQSAVSATIRSLEAEIGVPLFDRALRQIRLTSAGEALLPEARRVLDAVRGARDAVDATVGTVTGSVALGYMTSVTLVDIPVLLREFAQRHPQVDITLKAAEHGTQGLIDMLRDGELDLALIAVYHDVPALEIVPIARSPLHLTAPVGHPLLGLAPLELERVRGERFIDFPEGYGVRWLTDAAFGDAGVERHVAFETMDIAAVGELVENGLGMAFLPEFILDGLAGVEIVPLEHELQDMVVSVATPRSRPLSAAARAMRSLMLDPR